MNVYVNFYCTIMFERVHNNAHDVCVIYCYKEMCLFTLSVHANRNLQHVDCIKNVAQS